LLFFSEVTTKLAIAVPSFKKRCRAAQSSVFQPLPRHRPPHGSICHPQNSYVGARLVVPPPMRRSTIGDRAFPVAASRVWNFAHDTRVWVLTTVLWILLSLLDNEARPVYLGFYLFTVGQQNNFKLMLNCFGSSRVLTPVSLQCLKSWTFSLFLSLVSSRPNPKCLGSTHVLEWL